MATNSRKGKCLRCEKEIANWWEQFCSKECVDEYKKFIYRESFPKKSSLGEALDGIKEQKE